MILLKSHLYIPTNLFSDAMRRELTFDNPAYAKAIQMELSDKAIRSIPPKFYLYREVKSNTDGKNVIQIPRFYRGFLFRNDVKSDVGCVEESFGFKFPEKFSFNIEQQETIRSTVEMLKAKLGAVIVAKTGEGKTIMALKIISEMGYKALILVHKNMLIEQWREKILQFTFLKEDDIGLLQQGKFKDGKIVIGSQQSLMNTTIDDSINKNFGIVIQDEVHRIGAKMFLRAFTRFNSKYRLGLSATPHREDKLEKIYFYHISNNLVFHTPVRNWNSNYKVVEYVRKVPWKMYPAFIPYKIAVINNITMDEDRNKFVAKHVADLLKSGRKVLVLSERIRHLKELIELTRISLGDDYRKYKPVRFFGAETLTKKQRKMGVKQEKIEDPSSAELSKADVVFATYSKAKEGVDIPHLDTLLFATPLSSETTVVQSKGRIERQHSKKAHPLIIDIDDYGIKLCQAMLGKRRFIYLKYGMNEV